MKLVIATPLYPPEIGGPATYAKTLAEGLLKRGIEVEVVAFSEVRHLPRILRHYAYYRRVRSAARSADVVLALDPFSVGFPALRAARRAKKPFVVKIVGDYAWEQGTQRFGVTETLDEFIHTKKVPFPVRVFRWVQVRVAQSATRIVVPSHYLQMVVRAWGVPESRIHVIYNAVPLEELGTVPKSVQSLPRPLVVTAGRLVPWKHIEGVIDAVAAVPYMSLAIVGDGPERTTLAKRAAEQLGARVVFTGALSHADLLATVKSASVLVLNSSYEGLSHVLVEAAMLGVPIIATNAGGNNEVVEEGVNGILVPVGNTDKLVQALRESKASRRANTSKFTEEAMLAATETLLTSL